MVSSCSYCRRDDLGGEDISGVWKYAYLPVKLIITVLDLYL